jgi:hypothetical protein
MAAGATSDNQISNRRSLGNRPADHNVRESMIDLRDGLRRVSPADEFTEMLDESTVDERASNRSAKRWSSQVDEEEATWIGTLIDLAEQRKSIGLATTTGQNHRVVIDAVGPDVVVAQRPDSTQLLIRLEIIESLTGAGKPTATGIGTGQGATFHELLFGLCADRPKVSVTTRSGRVVHGQLLAVGTDVLTLRSLDSAASEHRPVSTMIPVFAAAEVVVHAN